MDLDQGSDRQMGKGLELLEDILEDVEQVQGAWETLCSIGKGIFADRLSINRDELIKRLGDAGFKLKPPSHEDKWHRMLEDSKVLLDGHHPEQAILLLNQLEEGLDEVDVDSSILYRLHRQRSVALSQLNQNLDALEAAERALDIKPDGVRALVLCAWAASLSHQPRLALDFAKRATTVGPSNELAWAARIQVCAIADEPEPEVPSGISKSTDCRIALAMSFVLRGDIEKQLELTTELLAEDVKVPEVLYHQARAQTLVRQDESKSDAKRRYRQAERLATRLIESNLHDGHPMKAKALQVRSRARELLEQPKKAQQDLDEVAAITPKDPDVILRSCESYLNMEKPEKALALIPPELSEEFPILIALRAWVRCRLNDQSGARQDLDTAIATASKTDSPGQTRLYCAQVALELRDLELTSELLKNLTDPETESPQFSLFSGRLAMAGEDIEVGASHYREAAIRQPGGRREIYSELASQLLNVDHATEAVATFDELGEDEVPTRAIPVFARALMLAHELERASDVISRLLDESDPPRWALAAAAELAHMQEDSSKEAELLKELLLRDDSSERRLYLADCLMELGRIDEAKQQMEILREAKDLHPRSRAHLAQMMVAMGDDENGVCLAHRTYREAPDDPIVNVRFIGAALESHWAPEPPSEIGPDTHVEFVGDDGDTRNLTIFSTPPIEGHKKQIGIGDAKSLNLIGLKMGDEVPQDPLNWTSDGWTVGKIVPAVAFDFTDAMQHYDERFPTHPRFLKSFSVNQDNPVQSFAPVVGALGVHVNVVTARRGLCLWRVVLTV
jgi:tetratricopeptide (TPR) repeat protein